MLQLLRREAGRTKRKTPDREDRGLDEDFTPVWRNSDLRLLVQRDWTDLSSDVAQKKNRRVGPMPPTMGGKTQPRELDSRPTPGDGGHVQDEKGGGDCTRKRGH